MAAPPGEEARPGRDAPREPPLGTEVVFGGLYDLVRERFTLSTIRAENVVTLLMFIAAAADREESLSGAERQQVVLCLVDRLLGEIPGDAGEKLALQAAVQLLLPPLVDALAEAGRGAAGAARRGGAPGCWAHCFPCCFAPGANV